MRPTNSIQLSVSIAKQSDRPLIARLSRRAAGRSDYVLRILPSAIDRGGLFLAWDDSELVGMTNYDKCIDGSGWLSMARTDPTWRRRGVAIFLQQKIAAYARQRGVGTLRLVVSSENKPSIKACKKGGFRRVFDAANITCRLSAKRTRQRVSRSSVSQKQLQLLMNSPSLTKSRGYVGYRRHFVKLTKPILMRLRSVGELFVTGDSILLITRPERTFRKPQSSLTILSGPIAKSLTVAKEIAQGMGASILRSYIPYSQYEISVAKRVGFRRSRWGKHFFVFEKKI